MQVKVANVRVVVVVVAAVFAATVAAAAAGAVAVTVAVVDSWKKGANENVVGKKDLQRDQVG